MSKQPDLITTLILLNQSVKQLEARYSYWQTFVRGMFSGLGTVVGATVVVGIIAYLLRNVELIPLIGSWLSAIIQQVELSL